MRQSQREIDASERRMSKNTMVSGPTNKIPANFYSCRKLSDKILGQTADFLAKGGIVTLVPSPQQASAKAQMNHVNELGV